MIFLCLYCDYKNPITLTVVNFENNTYGREATAFYICPDCKNKFIVKIQDVGKVR